jgi:hypothetical protein
MHACVDAAQIRADFDRDGYVVCRGALDGYDFAPLRQLIERQVESQAERLAAVRGDAFDAHEQATFEARWAELAREFAADPAVPEDQRALVNATWGGMDMLDEATYALYTCPACRAIATTLLGPEVQANGDFWFRAAVSEDIGIDWGYEYHQDSFNCPLHVASDCVYMCCMLLHLLALAPTPLFLVFTDEDVACLQTVRHPTSSRSKRHPERFAKS